MNDASFLGYSTKVMAATDDAFAYILGRAKMREKALISALDQNKLVNLTSYRYYSRPNTYLRGLFSIVIYLMRMVI